jgi:excisionase family DNA binding protein
VTLTAVGAPGQRPSYEWISPTQAAARLDMPIRRIYQLIDTGRLPGYRIGNEIKLLAHEVDEFRHRPAAR